MIRKEPHDAWIFLSIDNDVEVFVRSNNVRFEQTRKRGEDLQTAHHFLH